MGTNMQWLSLTNGAIVFKGMTNVGFNVKGGISGNPNNREIQTYSSSGANNEIFFMGSLPPIMESEASAVLLSANHLCLNRGSVGGEGGYSVIVSTLTQCAASVASNPNCGTQFSYSTVDKYCDCVPSIPGACTFYTDQNTVNGEYNTFTLAPYLYIKWNLALCYNRGGVGGSNTYSVNKGNLQECAAYVAANTACGQEFSFGKRDGWCDCVPKSKGPCTFYTDSGTEANAYSVYTLGS